MNEQLAAQQMLVEMARHVLAGWLTLGVRYAVIVNGEALALGDVTDAEARAHAAELGVELLDVNATVDQVKIGTAIMGTAMKRFENDLAAKLADGAPKA